MTYKELCQSGNYAQVYSIQQQHAYEHLKRVKLGEKYIPSVDNSHASKCGDHKRAYQWLAEQFEEQKGYSAEDAFFWVFFDEQTIDDVMPKQSGDLYKVTLCVPISEMLVLLNARHGWESILGNRFWKGRQSDGSTPNNLINDAYIKSSWEAIFAEDDDLITSLQAVIDRVEYEWIKNIEELPNE